MVHIGAVFTAIHPIFASLGTINPPTQCGISDIPYSCQIETIAFQLVNIVHEIVRLIPVKF